MKLSLAFAALVSSLLAGKSAADPVVAPAAPECKLCRVFCFRITDIRQDGNIDDRFHFEFEVLNWADTLAGGVKLALVDATDDGIKFAQDTYFNLSGVDSDLRPIQMIDVNMDGVINDADLEDLNRNNVLDVGEDKNGNNRIDNDPIYGNVQRPNDFFLFNQTEYVMEWRAGSPIPFQNLVDSCDCQ